MKTIFDKIFVIHCLKDKNRLQLIKNKLAYLGLKYEFMYSIPLTEIFNNTQNFIVTHNIHTNENIIDTRHPRYWSMAFAHYMCVYQAYELNMKKLLIIEDDVVINKDKDLMFRYLNDIPNDADFIRYGYMSYKYELKQLFDNTSDLFYKDNINDDNLYYGNQCYALMNRKTMKIYLDSCNYYFKGNEDVDNIHRGNKFNINVYYATKPSFLDYIAYQRNCDLYSLPYSDELINKYDYIE